MKGKPARIELSKDATPTSTGHYRTIANAYLDPLKKELDVQVDAGILEKMEEKPDAANYWLHPIVVVPKKGTTDIGHDHDSGKSHEQDHQDAGGDHSGGDHGGSD